MKRPSFSFFPDYLGWLHSIVCNKDDNKQSTDIIFSVWSMRVPDAAALDMYVNSSLIASNFTYGSDTGYYLLTPGTYLVQIATAGSSTFLVTENVTMSPA